MKNAVFECMKCDRRIVIGGNAVAHVKDGNVYELSNHVCRNDHPPSNTWIVVEMVDADYGEMYSDYSVYGSVAEPPYKR